MSNDHGNATSAEGTKQSLAGESGEMNDAMLTMDELMAQYEAAEPLQELREGDVVTGTVVQIDEQCAMIDVGTKSEGMIPKAELDEIRDQIAVGDQIQVCVHRIEDEEGNLIVSKRQADYERACTALEQLLAAQQVETLGADAYGLPLAGSFADSAEFTRHFEALRKTCEQRPLSDKPWLLLGAIQYGRRSFADARDALQRYSENTLAPARPNGAAMKLLESAKKLAN